MQPASTSVLSAADYSAYGASKTKATNEVEGKLSCSMRTEEEYQAAAKILLACVKKTGKQFSYGELANLLCIPQGGGAIGASSQPSQAQRAGIKAPIDERNAYILVKLFSSAPGPQYRRWSHFFKLLETVGLKTSDFNVYSEGRDKFSIKVPSETSVIKSLCPPEVYRSSSFPYPSKLHTPHIDTMNGLVRNCDSFRGWPGGDDFLSLGGRIGYEKDNLCVHEKRVAILRDVLNSALPDSEENTMEELCNAFGISLPGSAFTRGIFGSKKLTKLEQCNYIADAWIKKKAPTLFRDFLQSIQNCYHYPAVVETALHNGYITHSEVTKGNLSPGKLSDQPVTRYNTIALDKDFKTFTKKQIEDFGDFLYLAFRGQEVYPNAMLLALSKGNSDGLRSRSQLGKKVKFGRKDAQLLSEALFSKADKRPQKGNGDRFTLEHVFGYLGASRIEPSQFIPKWSGPSESELFDSLNSVGKELVEKTRLDGCLDMDNIQSLYAAVKQSESVSQGVEDRRQNAESHARPRVAVNLNPDGRKQPSAPPEFLQPSIPASHSQPRAEASPAAPQPSKPIKSWQPSTPPASSLRTEVKHKVRGKLDSIMGTEEDYIAAAEILLTCMQNKEKDFSYGELAERLSLPYGAGHKAYSNYSKPTHAQRAGIKATIDERNAYIIVKLFCNITPSHCTWYEFFAALSKAGLVIREDGIIRLRNGNKFSIKIPGDIPAIKGHWLSGSSDHLIDPFMHPSTAYTAEKMVNGLVWSAFPASYSSQPDDGRLTLGAKILTENSARDKKCLVHLLNSALPTPAKNTMQDLCDAFGISPPLPEDRTTNKFKQCKYVVRAWLENHKEGLLSDFLQCIQNCHHHPIVVERALHNGFIAGQEELTAGDLSPRKLSGGPTTRYNTIALNKEVSTFTKEQKKGFEDFLYLAFKNQTVPRSAVCIGLTMGNSSNTNTKHEQIVNMDQKNAQLIGRTVIEWAKQTVEKGGSRTLSNIVGYLGAGDFHSKSLPQWNGTRSDAGLTGLLTPLGQELVKKTMIDGYLDLDNIQRLSSLPQPSAPPVEEKKQPLVSPVQPPLSPSAPSEDLPPGYDQLHNTWPVSPAVSQLPSAPPVEGGAAAGVSLPSYTEVDTSPSSSDIDPQPPAYGTHSDDVGFIMTPAERERINKATMLARQQVIADRQLRDRQSQQ